MTQEKFDILATEKVKALINFIASKNYNKLSSVMLIDNSWCGEEKTQEKGIAVFVKWMTEQLALWAEDYGKEFVVDPFDEKKLRIGKLDNGHSFTTYFPTSFGEELDFWFEFDFHINDDELISKFNINI